MATVVTVVSLDSQHYHHFGDIIKETMTRTRQNDRLRNALSLLLCLQQVSGLFPKVRWCPATAARGTRPPCVAQARKGAPPWGHTGHGCRCASLPAPRESRTPVRAA